MTKADIISEIAKSTGVPKGEVALVVENFMECVKTSLASGKNVYLRGFGTFLIKSYAEKTARNITKRTTIIIPAGNKPAFKPSDDFISKVKKEK